MADVFVSYQKADRKLAERVVNALAEAGYSVWWDDRLTPAESWDRLIEREIGAAKCVLVLWTERSVGSDWVRIEANFAKDARPSKLIQARFDTCAIPMAYSLIQHADVSARSLERDAGWLKVLQWIAVLAGAPSKAGEMSAVVEAPARRGQFASAQTPELKPAPDKSQVYLWGLTASFVVGVLASLLFPFFASRSSDFIRGPWLWVSGVLSLLDYVVAALVLLWSGRFAVRQGVLLVVFGGLRFGVLGASSFLLPWFVNVLSDREFFIFLSGLVQVALGLSLLWLIGLLLGAFQRPRSILAPLLLSALLLALPVVFYTLRNILTVDPNSDRVWAIWQMTAPPAILFDVIVAGLLLALFEPLRARR